MEIKRVVQLTNEQYEALLKTGQVEVDGIIRTKEEDTVYVCPATESWAELNNKIDELILNFSEVESLIDDSGVIEYDVSIQD